MEDNENLNQERECNLNEEKVLDNLENEVADENIAQNKKSKLPIIVGGLVGLIIICCTWLLVSYLMSPKNSFIRLVNGAMSNISNETSKFEKSVFGQLLSIDTKSKLVADIKIKGELKTEDSEIKEWLQNLESFELNAKENIDFNNDYTETNAEILLNGEKYLNGALLQNKNIISGRLDNITDGYITVDNNNLPSLWQKIGYDGPDSLTSGADIFKEIDFSKSDMKELKNVIGNFTSAFFAIFDDENFSYGKGSVEYDEGTLECKSMDFDVSEEDFNEGVIAGLNKILSNEKSLDVLYKIVCYLDKINGLESFSREEFVDVFEMMIQEMQNAEIEPGSDNGFIMRVYYNGNKICKIEILSRDYNAKLLEFTTVKGKDSNYYKLSNGAIVYEDKVNVVGNVITHNLSTDYTNYETGEILEGYGSESVITIDSTNKDEQIINLVEKVRLLSYDDDIENIDIMTIEPTVVKNYTLRGKVNQNDNIVEFILTDSDNEFSSTLSIVADIKEKADFEYSTISEGENFIVADKSDEEFNSKKDKIISNWQATAGSDSSKVKMFETAVYMYLNMFIPIGTY